MAVKCVITRTSSRDEVPPCEGVTPEMRPYVDRRKVASADQLRYPCNAAKDWYARGSNHRLIDGCIARDLEHHRVWVREFATLEELLELCKVEGQLILELGPEGEAVIEIYDDCRE